MMTEGRGFSNAKAKWELGWEPRYPSWRQGFKVVRCRGSPPPPVRLAESGGRRREKARG